MRIHMMRMSLKGMVYRLDPHRLRLTRLPCPPSTPRWNDQIHRKIAITATYGHHDHHLHPNTYATICVHSHDGRMVLQQPTRIRQLPSCAVLLSQYPGAPLHILHDCRML